MNAVFAEYKLVHAKPDIAVNNKTTYLTGSRDAPHISTLPPDVTLFAVEKAIPLL